MHIVSGDSPSVPTHNPATALLQLADPWERARQAEVLSRQLHQSRTAVLRVRRDAVRQLVRELRAPQAQVARHLGLTKARIGQLVTTARSTKGVAA